MQDRNVTIAKDFLGVENNDGKLMFVILHNKETEEPQSDAKILYGDKGPHAVLIKNDNHAIILDYLDSETLKIMKRNDKVLITEIDYNEKLIKYSIKNKLKKEDLHKLFEYAETQHVLRACYEVVLEKIPNFDERFLQFIDEELKESK